MNAPLTGIKVLDVATMVAAPYGATMLGDMGADVIKIEPPRGDESRYLGPRDGTDSGTFVGTNRNKRSIVIDFTTDEGKRLFHKLLKDADILINNMRGSAREKLGMTYKELTAVNPEIICISVSTYGQSGPYAGRPGIDPSAQALSGFMAVTGEKGGHPIKAGPPIADASCANLVAYAAMLGLWTRMTQKKAQEIEVCLIDAIIHVQPVQVGQFFALNYQNPRAGNGSPFYTPYGTFTCKDGKDIHVATYNDKFFRNFCLAIGSEALADDPRFSTVPARQENKTLLDQMLNDVFKQYDRPAMMKLLEANDTIAAPVYDYEQTFQDPQVIHNEMAVEVDHAKFGKIKVSGVPIKMLQTPGSVRRAPPTLGQQTREILAELHIGDAEIEELISKKVINDC